MSRIWHPYTQMRDFQPVGEIVAAEGVWLQMKDGRRLLDGIASWWVNIHGHSHPEIVACIAQQSARFDQVILADFTHQPAEQLTARLGQILPGDLDRVFFSDNGSTAVEVALKMAFQGQGKRGGGRDRFVAFQGSYHGDTVGAMSVGSRGVFNAPFESLLFDVDFLPYGDGEALSRYLDSQGERVIAVIVEPLIQGASGMVFSSPEFLAQLRSGCDRCGALLIADEVAVGFGRTGTLFAVEQAQVVPDIICLSKGITGGSIALGVTVCRPALYDLFLGGAVTDGLLHGHSYCGNPIACASAVTSIDLFESERTLENVARMGLCYEQWAPRFTQLSLTRNVRHMGGLFAFEVGDEKGGYVAPLGREIANRAVEKGLYIRPLGNTVYLMPPLSITPAELDGALEALHQSVKEQGK